MPQECVEADRPRGGSWAETKLPRGALWRK